MLILWNDLNPLEAFVWTNPVREAQRISQQQDEKTCIYFFGVMNSKIAIDYIDSYLQISTGFYFAYVL